MQPSDPSFLLSPAKGRKRKKRRCAGLGGDLNLGIPEWQSSVLTTTPCCSGVLYFSHYLLMFSLNKPGPRQCIQQNG